MLLLKIYFIISGIISFIVAIYRINKKSKYVEINGICIYVSTQVRHFRKRCGYKYEYNGKTHEHYDKGYFAFKIKKGEKCKLYINPDNVKEVYTPSDIAITRYLIILTIGFAILTWLELN